MDGVDSLTASTTETACDHGSRRRGSSIAAGRSLQVAGAAPNHCVTSEIDSQTPVSEAEIALVLGVLGDSLHDILFPVNQTCSPPTDPADA
jgi:hypothetical protein